MHFDNAFSVITGPKYLKEQNLILITDSVVFNLKTKHKANPVQSIRANPSKKNK